MTNKEKIIAGVVGLIVSSIIVIYIKDSVIVKSDSNLTVVSTENENIQIKKDEFGFNLPVIVIDTNGQVINTDNTIQAGIQVFNNTNEYNYLSDEAEQTENISIKIRGNSTRHYPKKQYAFEFVDDEGNDKESEFLGMDTESDWILNAPFADKSLMRNYLVYNISKDIMDYSPTAKFCEVFVVDDGAKELEEKHYKGVYVAIEKIKRDENRVDIRKTNDKDEQTSFIVAKDRLKSGELFYRNYGSETYIYDYKMINIYPNNPTEEQSEYINKTISDFERILYSDRYDDPIEGYSKYIDVDSFVDYYIINEFTKNLDAGILSTYIHMDLGDKIKAGPIWDFNNSLGNYQRGDIIYMDPTGFYMVQKSWFDRLLMDKNFVDKVITRYRMLRETYLSDDYWIESIDNAVNLLGDAIERNMYKWPFWVCNQEKLFTDRIEETAGLGSDLEKISAFMDNNPKLLEDTDYFAASYDEEIQMIKEFVFERGKWLDENIESLYKFTK